MAIKKKQKQNGNQVLPVSGRILSHSIIHLLLENKK